MFFTIKLILLIFLILTLFNICGSFNQVNGLHQQIVIKVLVYFEQKVQTDFAKGKGNNQSCDMKSELIEMAILFFLDFHIAEGQKMRRNSIIFEGYFRVRQLFRVNELLSLLLDIEKYQTLTLALLVYILDAKDPHVSEVDEIGGTVQ